MRRCITRAKEFKYYTDKTIYLEVTGATQSERFDVAKEIFPIKRGSRFN